MTPFIHSWSIYSDSRYFKLISANRNSRQPEERWGHIARGAPFAEGQEGHSGRTCRGNAGPQVNARRLSTALGLNLNKSRKPLEQSAQSLAAMISFLPHVYEKTLPAGGSLNAEVGSRTSGGFIFLENYLREWTRPWSRVSSLKPASRPPNLI